ncbi:MAG: 16S rRNA processing protein RimM [Alphaproteobacteria bacterium]|nr:16S rRNA processing protein RimM [Alphaproteobacteria bacterium]
MNTNEKILVGKIVAPQGLRGEFRVQTFSQTPMDFQHFRVLSDRFTPEQFHFVRVLNPKSDVIIARVDNIFDRNSAETLRGTELFILRSDLPALKSDEFYQCDLIGFSVIRDNKNIGIITGFYNFGGGDIIELDNGEMVSFIGASVDTKRKVITVK